VLTKIEISAILFYRYLLIKSAKDNDFFKRNLERFKKVAFYIYAEDLVFEDLPLKYDSLDVGLLKVMLKDFD